MRLPFDFLFRIELSFFIFPYLACVPGFGQNDEMIVLRSEASTILTL